MSADKIFEALSSAPRRRILAFLSKTDMTAGEIAERFADLMSQPAISKHLRSSRTPVSSGARSAARTCTTA